MDATIRGMRVRISTTIDEGRLKEARRRTGSRDSELFDRALVALLDLLDTEAELAAIAAAPYESDPEPAMPGADPTGENYLGSVPAAVRRLAKTRRAARAGA